MNFQGIDLDVYLREQSWKDKKSEGVQSKGNMQCGGRGPLRACNGAATLVLTKHGDLVISSGMFENVDST